MDTLKKIGKYKYAERHCLGQGSFGKVYEGVDQSGRRVAIKKIQQRMIATDPYLKQALSTQITIMKRLKHRNIVELIDTVTTANSIYLILQFCSGGDLKRYSLNKRFSEEQALNIFQQLIQGFFIIVKEGIIHRDLKPANVLVHEGTFKICDFGFAKFFGEMNKMAKTCVGTPIYMSPQVLKQRPYTSKSDVWSLGVMYYELLFGKIPYLGKSQDEIFKLITRGKLTIPACSQKSYLFLKNTLVIDQQERWDWNKVFDHFDIKPKQKPAFYQNFVNNFLKSNNQEIRYHTTSNQNLNRQNKNQSFKDKAVIKYGNNEAQGDSPQREQDFQRKGKHNKMARNIFAQDDSPLFNPYQQKARINQNQPQQKQSPHQRMIIQPAKIFFQPQRERIYRPQQTQKIRWLYSISTRFLLKQSSTNYKSISSYQKFIYSLVYFTIQLYNKHLSQSNIKQLQKIKIIILKQQRQILKKLLSQVKKFDIKCHDIKPISSIIKLEGNYILNRDDLEIVDQLNSFGIIVEK